DELLALGYNTGARNMRLFARGVPPGPMARSYHEEVAAHGEEAVRVWRGEAAEEITEIAIAVEPDAEPKPSEAKTVGTIRAEAEVETEAGKAPAKKASTRKAPAKKVSVAAEKE
ncbi:hypothetical protein ABZ054_31040, partial [Streptomyces sp. NPDC006324]